MAKIKTHVTRALASRSKRAAQTLAAHQRREAIRSTSAALAAAAGQSPAPGGAAASSTAPRGPAA